MINHQQNGSHNMLRKPFPLQLRRIFSNPRSNHSLISNVWTFKCLNSDPRLGKVIMCEPSPGLGNFILVWNLYYLLAHMFRQVFLNPVLLAITYLTKLVVMIILGDKRGKLAWGTTLMCFCRNLKKRKRKRKRKILHFLLSYFGKLQSPQSSFLLHWSFELSL